MTFKRFLRVMLARSLRIFVTTALTVAVAFVVTTNQPTTYSTSSSLVLATQEPSPFEQRSVSRQFTTRYVLTQVDIISSRTVASRVLEQLTEPEKTILATSFLEPDSAQQAVATKDWVQDRLVSELLQNLEVRPSRESMVLNLTYTATDPELAAKIANSFADAYISVSLDLNTEPARRNAEWFNGQLKELRATLREKQRVLTQYQQEHGIISIDERLDAETQRFEELSTSLIEAQAATYDVESRQLGRQHPEYVRAIEREQAIRAALSRQQARLFSARSLRDDLDLLVRDVEIAKSNYESALERYYRSSLESQFNQTNVAVLNPAKVPVQPTSPSLSMNLAAATALGLIFGIGLALLSEALDQKVRIEEDLEVGLGIPVMASF